MMITKINRIKSLGLVFSDYKREEDLPPFRRFNLIYGWNWSGKTTLSRLFRVLGGDGPDNSDVKYEVVDQNGQLHKEGSSAYTHKIKVFNSDYIAENLQLTKGIASSLSILLGIANIEVARQIEADERALNGDPTNMKIKGKIAQYEELDRTKSSLEKERGSKFTETARLIGIDSGDYARRTYRKPDAESDFAKLKGKALLEEEDLEEVRASLRQKSFPTVKTLTLDNVTFEDGHECDLQKCLEKVMTAVSVKLEETVQSKVLTRLVENQDIADWIEHGIEIHGRHKSKVCEYCRQNVPTARGKELLLHFSDEVKKLKVELSRLLDRLSECHSVVVKLTLPNSAELYDELRKAFAVTTKKFLKAQSRLLDEIRLVEKDITAKSARTYETGSLSCMPNAKQFVEAIGEVNGLIKKHNIKTEDFEKIKERSYQRLRDHWLSTIWDDVKQWEASIQSSKDGMSRLLDGDSKQPADLGITALRQRIAANRAKISSAAKACEEINSGLKSFLGHDELSFELREPKKNEKDSESAPAANYAIMRSGCPAKSLSEGEKTAIAFVYFTIDLRSEGFDLKNGIIVLDDPISSLDMDVMYRTCAFIEKKLNCAGQLFILTHNYEFFNQAKLWFRNEFNSASDETKHQADFFMLDNYYDKKGGTRRARLRPLDSLLRDFETEYHFLFKKLLHFNKDNPPDGDTSIEAVYNYPTLARKLLECFLSFRVPTRGTFYSRLLNLKKVNKNISGQEMGFVYSFVNSHSHLDTKNGLLQFDPTLTLNGRQNVELVLKLVKMADEKHYKMMTRVVG